MRTIAVLIVSAFLGGCGGDGSDTENTNGGLCANPSGLFKVHQVRQSGTCTTPDDYVYTETGAATVGLDPGCTGIGNTTSTDNCTSMIDETCPLADRPGYQWTKRGKLTSNHAATSASGTLYIEIISSTGVECTGIYDLTITKL